MYMKSAALSSATQHAMPSEIGRKWETECLNTRFPVPSLLWAGYSVKLIIDKNRRIISIVTKRRLSQSEFSCRNRTREAKSNLIIDIPNILCRLWPQSLLLLNFIFFIVTKLIIIKFCYYIKTYNTKVDTVYQY